MFEVKYKKGLIIAVIILVIIALGTLTFFIIDFVKTSNSKKEASDAVRVFEEIDDEEDDKNANNIDNNVVALNLQVENVVQSDDSSNNEGEKMYKGFPMAGTIKIPKIKLELPVLKVASAKAIDVSVAINGGPGLNKVGNTIIIGHNYRDGRFFANNKNLSNGDEVSITDNSGTTVKYEIYNIYTTAPEDSDFMERDTEGRREITLDTCTDDAQSRLIIWAKEK